MLVCLEYCTYPQKPETERETETNSNTAPDRSILTTGKVSLNVILLNVTIAHRSYLLPHATMS